MNEFYLSKSNYCSAVQCNKILWLDEKKHSVATDTSNKSVLANGIRVGELARGLFGEYTNVENNNDKSIMILETEELLEQKTRIITEASFAFEKNFASVDILKNEEDGIEIYEVKSTTSVKDIYLDDISYQVYILKNLGYNVKSANIVYLNNKYIRYGELELDKLFVIEDVTEIAFSKQEEVQNKIDEINEYLKQKDEPEDCIGMQCFQNNYDCAYWQYCSRNLPEKNVFNIDRLQTKKKVELFQVDKVSFADILPMLTTDRFKQQVNAELTDEVTIKKDEIREFLKQIKYPIYFLDFEGYEIPIPEYDGSWAYEQIPFQYSIHIIENEGAEVKHEEFIAENGKDPRRIIAEKLVEIIPENASIVVYNLSYEKTRMREFGELFEDLKARFDKMQEQIIDLITPFRSRWYYCKEMNGSSSIKQVLPALFPNEPELDYHNLPVVHNGTEASETYLDLPNYSKEEQEEIKKGMLMYCGLDTYALVKVWEKLKNVLEE